MIKKNNNLKKLAWLLAPKQKNKEYQKIINNHLFNIYKILNNKLNH